MNELYDAIVVGSGATGGWAAMELTSRGLRVLVLEAGPLLSGAPGPPAVGRARGFRSLLGGRGRQPVQSRCYACKDDAARLFVDDLMNPYTTLPGSPFDWFRSRQVGGRTLLWLGHCYRFSEQDFKAASRDGFGEDWPIGYADVAPYYDRVERFLGVSGRREGLAQLPDGVFSSERDVLPGEQAFSEAVLRRWPDRRVTPARVAGRARPPLPELAALPPEQASAAFGWSSAPSSTLLVAASTGRLTLRANHVVRSVDTDAETGLGRSVRFVDTQTMQEGEARARVILLCASTLESTRLLLNSASPRHPSGLGNSSGVLGRYLMDHVHVQIQGVAPQISAYAEDADVGPGVYVPRFRNLTTPSADFLRGYGVQAAVLPFLFEAPAGTSDRKATRAVQRLFSPLARRLPGAFHCTAFGEMLPRPENRVTIDASVVDAWGIPALRIHCTHSANELALARDMLASVREMAEEAGFRVLKRMELATPGHAIHESGTARMGRDPRGSVLNSNNQLWDAPNVFVTDGACFVTSPCQNPTLTMMALTARACDFIMEQRAGGAL